MKNLALAVVIVLTVAGLLNKVVGKELALTILGAVVVLHQWLDKMLEKREIAPNLTALPTGLVRFEGFTLPWGRMTVYATLVLIGLFNLSAYAATVAVRLTTAASQAHLVFGGWISQLATQPAGTVFAMSTTLAIFLSPYLVGIWIGERCDRFGLLTVTTASLFAKAVDSSMSFFLIEPQTFEALFGRPKTLDLLIEQIALGSLAMILSGMLGFFMGRRTRLSKYLAYLLNRLPTNSRDVLIDMAYEEAQRIRLQESR